MFRWLTLFVCCCSATHVVLAQPPSPPGSRLWAIELGGRLGWADEKQLIHYATNAKQLAQIQGDVRRVELFNCSRLTNQEAAHLRMFGTAEHVNLGYTPIGDDGLKHLAVLPQLTELYLGSTKVTDDGLKALSPLKKLKCLDLSGTGITDAGLKHLAEFEQLEKLFLSRTRVTGKGLAALAGCKNLIVLRLQGVSCEAADVSAFGRWEKLEELSLSPDDDGVRAAAELKTVKRLTIHGDRATDVGIAALASAAHLERLHFSQTSVTDRGYQSIKQALTKSRVSARPVWKQSAALNELATADKVLRWKPGTFDRMWGGLARAPAVFPGIKRWQLETVEPRTAIVSIDWHPDGKRVAVGTIVGHIRVYEMNDTGFRFLMLIPAHDFTPIAVKWKPDGTRIASVSPDTRFCIWSADGKLVFEHKDQAYLNDVDWSPDGKQIVVACNNSQVKMFSADGAPGPVLGDHTKAVRSVDWHPDGTQFATGSNDSTIRLWTADGKPAGVWTEHKNNVSRVEWSRDGKFLASSSLDKTLKIWSRDGKVQHSIEDIKSVISDIAWLADGQAIVATALNNVHLKKPDGTKIRSRRRRSNVDCVAAHPTEPEMYLTSTRGDSLLHLRDMKLNAKKGIGDAVSPTISAIAWHPDSRRLATGGWDNLVRLWSADGKLEQQVAGHESFITDLAYSPNGETLAALSDKSLHLCTENGLPIAQAIGGKQVGAKSVAWHPDGSRLVTGYWKGGLTLWSAEAEKLKTIPTKRPVRRITWKPDGSQFLAGGDLKLLRHFASDGTPGEHVIHSKLAGAQLVADWSPDGKRFVTGGWGAKMWLWSADGKLVKELNPRSSVLASAWKPDSSVFASVFFDGRIQFNSGKDGKWLRNVKSDRSVGQKLAWSPDGKWIATGSTDNTLRIWNAETGRLERLTLNFWRGFYVTISPAGQLLHGNNRPFLEQHLVYVVENEDGRLELLSMTQFEARLRGE